MSVFPRAYWPPLVTVSTRGIDSAGPSAKMAGDTMLGSSATWSAANRALFYAFVLTEPVVAVKMFTYNGTTTSDNFDIGIYDVAGTRLVSTGSTAQSGINTIQVVDVTDTLLGPGIFYLALAANSTSTTFWGGSGINITYTPTGVALMNSAFPLPATATLTATGYAPPIFGFSTREVV